MPKVFISDRGSDGHQAERLADRGAMAPQQDQPLGLLELLLARAPIGLAALDRDLRHRWSNATWAAMHGLPPDARLGRTVREIVPALAPALEPLLRRVLDAGEPLVDQEVSGEVPAAPGLRRHWLASIYPLRPGRADDSQVAAVGVALVDITARTQAEQVEQALRDSEAHHRALSGATPDAIMLIDDHGTCLDVNERMCRTLRAAREELLGAPVGRFALPGMGEAAEAALAQLRAHGDLRVPFPLRAANGAIVELEWAARANVVPGLHLCVAHEIGGRGRAGTRRARATQHVAILAEAGDVLAASLDYQTTLASVARLAVRHLADWCTVSLLEDDGRVHRVAVAHADPAKEALLRRLESRYPVDPRGDWGVPRVLRTGRPELHPVVPAAEYAGDAEHLRVFREVGSTSEMIVPFLVRGRAVGAITLARSAPGRRYGPTDLALAVELARRAAIAVDHARLYAAEQEARRRAEQAADRVARLQAVTAALSDALTPAQAAATVAAQAVAALGATTALVALLRDDGAQLEIVHSLGQVPDALAAWRRCPLDAPVPLAEAVRTGEPRWHASTAERGARSTHRAALAAPDQPGAWLSLPLLVEGRAIGGLSLGFPTGRAFGEADHAFALALARQCAQALERARLYEAERLARAAAEAARRRLAFLAEAGTVLAASLDYETTLNTVVQLAMPTLADFGFFDVVEPDGQVRRLARAHDNPRTQALLEPTRWARSERTDINLCALSTGLPGFHPEVDEAWLVNAAGGPEHLALMRELAFCSMLTVPLLARDQRLGALTLFYADSGRHHTEADLALAEELARRAAAAVEHARLFRQAQEAIRARDEFLSLAAHRLQVAVEAGQLGTWDWDIRGGTVIWSAALEAIHGLAPGTFGGTFEAYTSDIHPEDRDAVLQAIARTVDVGQDHHLEYRIVRPDGHVRWLEARGRLVRDRDGQLVAMTGVCMDVTERKRGEAEVLEALAAQRAANEQLERLNKAKGDFVSIVSHEFRTPLTGIQGFSELLRDEELGPEEVREYAGDIHREALRLNRMISELLDLDRLESGRMNLNLERVDLNAIAAQVAERAGRTAPLHVVRLELDRSLPLLPGDHDKLTQVVANLADNAIKYSPDGGEVAVGTRADGAVARLWVRDQGVGIPPHALETVFERYARVEAGPHRYIKGTGLGLPIVRQITELHGGRAWAESTPGHGSVFHVTLPLAGPPARE